MATIRRFLQTAQCSNWEHTCLLLNWDSTAVSSKDVHSTWLRSLTPLGKLWSSTLAVRQMSSLTPVARLQKWMMTTRWCPKFAKSGDLKLVRIKLVNGDMTAMAKNGYMTTLLLWRHYIIGSSHSQCVMIGYLTCHSVISGKSMFVKKADRFVLANTAEYVISELPLFFVSQRVLVWILSCDNLFSLQVHRFVNQTHFHTEGFLRGLFLKQRHNVSQKWGVAAFYMTYIIC